ncbi:WXG100 family type VII secretion target [Cytobacillus sp. Hz8]|uniref:WXG100 family type VII secretion target n=1 Tax=Cytobacillus sp. Hz8 TaxID=3347168 RepID=UPI0035DE7AB2
MGKVRIHDDKVKEAQVAAKALEQSIQTSLTSCNELVSYISGAKWSGRARDAFLSYLEIIQQYHTDMLDAAKKQTKALNNLDGYYQDFLQDCSVKEVRNL